MDRREVERQKREREKYFREYDNTAPGCNARISCRLSTCGCPWQQARNRVHDANGHQAPSALASSTRSQKRPSNHASSPQRFEASSCGPHCTCLMLFYRTARKPSIFIVSGHQTRNSKKYKLKRLLGVAPALATDKEAPPRNLSRAVGVAVRLFSQWAVQWSVLTSTRASHNLVGWPCSPQPKCACT